MSADSAEVPRGVVDGPDLGDADLGRRPAVRARPWLRLRGWCSVSAWDDATARARTPDPDPADAGPDGVTVAPWPAEVLPPDLRDYVAEVARGVGCPPDYVGATIITTAAAALGQAVQVRLRDGWAEAPTIWTAIVAGPGAGKTPATQEVLGPARAAADAAWATWDGAHQDWRRAMRTYDRDSRRTKSSGSDPGDPPAEPAMPRLLVSDATTEALTRLLAANPRGLLLARDELAGWLRAMDAYHAGGKGADRQWWLSVWSGVPTEADRVSTGYTRAPHPYVSVLGGIVPSRLADVIGGAGDDGLPDRLLWVYPDAVPPAPWTTQGISASARQRWAEVWATTRGYGSPPVEVTWTPMGGRIWSQHFNAWSAEMADAATPTALLGPMSKMRAYAARLALVLQALDDACAVRPTLGDVEAGAVDRAWTLVRYHLSHARRVYLDMATDAAEEASGREAQVLDMARAAGPKGVSREQVQEALGVSVRTARRVLARMVARGALVAIGDPTAPDRRYCVPETP